MWLILLFTGLIFLAVVHFESKNSKVLEAVGGKERIYSDLINAIREMPEYKILSYENFSLVATYLNSSNQHCKIDVFTTSKFTKISFSILYKGKWVRTAKKTFDECLVGDSLLLVIILNFPDCNLSNYTRCHD